MEAGYQTTQPPTAPATYADVAQKVDAEIEGLDKDDEVLKALGDDLQSAEAEFAAAEARYQLLSRWVANELEKPPEDAAPEVKATVKSQEKDVDDEAKIAVSAEQKAEKESHGEKNTSARPPKEVSRDKWEKQHAAKARVRELTKKSKQRDRTRARDAKFLSAEVDNQEEPRTESSKPAAPVPEKPAEEAAISDGAQKTADRLKCLKELPDAASNRATLLKIMTGGRENYFCCDPAEVLLDLEERSLVDADLACVCMKLLNDVAPVKGPPVPPEEWLAHAKKIATVERSDEKPVTENEILYLKSVDEKHLKQAEAEVLAAQTQLMELVQLSETWFPEAEEAPETAPKRQVSGEVKVDLDEAATLEAKNEHTSKVESKGSKNTSALSSKVASKQKWLADRGAWRRERENFVKARQMKRSAYLDMKLKAAEVPDDGN